MRYEEYRNLPEIVKIILHIAFEVDDIYEAIKGKKDIIEPNILFYSAILTAV
ncbi:MAG: hypothetical protein V1732_06130 [Patescibacteria group bacterium]